MFTEILFQPGLPCTQVSICANISVYCAEWLLVEMSNQATELIGVMVLIGWYRAVWTVTPTLINNSDHWLICLCVLTDHQKLDREARICRLLKHPNIGEYYWMYYMYCRYYYFFCITTTPTITTSSSSASTTTDTYTTVVLLFIVLLLYWYYCYLTAQFYDQFWDFGIFFSLGKKLIRLYQWSKCVYAYKSTI